MYCRYVESAHISIFQTKLKRLGTGKEEEILSRGRNLCLPKKGSSGKKEDSKKNLNSGSNSKPPIPNTPNTQTITKKRNSSC